MPPSRFSSNFVASAVIRYTSRRLHSPLFLGLPFRANNVGQIKANNKPLRRGYTHFESPKSRRLSPQTKSSKQSCWSRFNQRQHCLLSQPGFRTGVKDRQVEIHELFFRCV